MREALRLANTHKGQTGENPSVGCILVKDDKIIAHGVTAKLTFDTQFIETINTTGPTHAVIRASNAADLDTIGDREPMSFSEDFAHFCAAVPGCFLLMGNGEDGPNGQPLHSSDYDFNDALLPIGVKFWQELVRDRLPSRR